MNKRMFHGMMLFVGGVVSAFVGLIMGGYIGILTINLFPNQCFDGRCFSFIGYVGWEALGALGGMIGAVVGVSVFAFVVTRTKK